MSGDKAAAVLFRAYVGQIAGVARGSLIAPARFHDHFDERRREGAAPDELHDIRF